MDAHFPHVAHFLLDRRAEFERWTQFHAQSLGQVIVGEENEGRTVNVVFSEGLKKQEVTGDIRQKIK